jgi:hypothetical protein
MKDILLVLVLAALVMSVVVYVASGMEHQGQAWAYDVCRLYDICRNMHWLFAGTAIVIVGYLLARRAGA